MSWPTPVRLQALTQSERCCCVCHVFKGRNIELHHITAEADGGASDLENCIVLCADCHAEAGHYNPKHPRGSKYSPTELKRHRDQWITAVEERRRLQASRLVDNTLFEQQRVRLIGAFLPQRFPVPPHFLDPNVEGNVHAVYWILTVSEPFDFVAGSTRCRVERVHLCQPTGVRMYDDHQHLMGKRVVVDGTLDRRITAHHHGDALLWVNEIESAE